MPGMNDADVTVRLSELGIELPPPPKAVAAYVPVRIADAVAYVAGQVPMREGAVMHPGHLGGNVLVDEGQAAARQAALQALSALRDALGGFDRLEGIAQVTVYIASTSEFVDHPTVANGASELLVEVLGEPGKHARAAIGMASLPLGACVEVQVTAQLSS
jgi:enamine deaminase RidA (YjgF/YER057c/UK114 family)